MAAKKHWVTIIYKSGAKVHLRVEDLTVKWLGDDLTKLSWEGTDPETEPLFVSLSDIAAVWKGRV